MSALHLTSARFSKLWTPFVNHLLDRDFLLKNFFDFHIFSFFWFSIMILSYTLILSTSQLKTQQPMTLQIRSHIEYLIQTYNILVLILYSKLMRNVASLAVFNTIYWRFMIVVYFFGPPCILYYTRALIVPSKFQSSVRSLDTLHVPTQCKRCILTRVSLSATTDCNATKKTRWNFLRDELKRRRCLRRFQKRSNLVY